MIKHVCESQLIRPCQRLLWYLGIFRHHIDLMFFLMLFVYQISLLDSLPWIFSGFWPHLLGLTPFKNWSPGFSIRRKANLHEFPIKFVACLAAWGLELAARPSILMLDEPTSGRGCFFSFMSGYFFVDPKYSFFGGHFWDSTWTARFGRQHCFGNHSFREALDRDWHDGGHGGAPAALLVVHLVRRSAVAGHGRPHGISWWVPRGIAIFQGLGLQDAWAWASCPWKRWDIWNHLNSWWENLDPAWI